MDNRLRKGERSLYCSDIGQMVNGSVKAVLRLLGGISRLQECDPRSSLEGFETEGTRERW